MSLAPRVLHVIPSISPQRGGPSAAIMPMLRALREKGVRAEIATTNDNGTKVNDQPLNRFLEVDGVPTCFFHRFSPPLRFPREYAYARAFRPWFNLHARDYDLIHIHALFSHLSTTTMVLARRFEIPYISRPLGQLGSWPLKQSPWRKKFYLRAVEAANLRCADAVHFTSEWEQAEARDLRLNLRGTVIPHGVDLPIQIPDARERLREKLGLEIEHKIVLYLGRLHPKKGLNHLLAAFSKLDHGPCTLILAGNAEPLYGRQLGSLIAGHGQSNQVVRIGFVSGEEKQLLLQGVDLLALTSFHENFGLSVLEAIAAGTPVLVSDQVALAGEIRKYFLGEVVPLEVAAIRAGLQRMLESPGSWEQTRLREFVANFYSWKRNANSLCGLYASILERRSGGR